MPAWQTLKRSLRARTVVALLLIASLSLSASLETNIERHEDLPVLNETLRFSVNTTEQLAVAQGTPTVYAVITLVKSAGQVKGAKILLDSLRAREGQKLPFDVLVVPGPSLSTESQEELTVAGWHVVRGLRQIDHPFPSDCGDACDDLNVINAWKLPYTKAIYISPVMIAKSSIMPIFDLINPFDGVVATDDCGGQFSTAVFGFVPSVPAAHSLYLEARHAASADKANLVHVIGSKLADSLSNLPRKFNCEKGCMSSLDGVECSLIYAPGSCLDFDSKAAA